jgi:hypothetical protein
MASNPFDSVEQCAHALLREIQKLDELGLTFAASLVRIAHLDLQMRLHNVTEEDIDVLSFAAHALEQERLMGSAEQEKRPATDAPAARVRRGSG